LRRGDGRGARAIAATGCRHCCAGSRQPPAGHLRPWPTVTAVHCPGGSAVRRHPLAAGLLQWSVGLPEHRAARESGVEPRRLPPTCGAPGRNGALPGTEPIYLSAGRGDDLSYGPIIFALRGPDGGKGTCRRDHLVVSSIPRFQSSGGGSRRYRSIRVRYRCMAGSSGRRSAHSFRPASASSQRRCWKASTARLNRSA
jgi:hypothetical protein